jgi:hypothetical protein
MAPVVRDGTVDATSKDVATTFGKEHRNVLSDIDHILAHPDLDAPDVVPWFQQVEEPHPFNGSTVRSYRMNKNGWHRSCAMARSSPTARTCQHVREATRQRHPGHRRDLA